MEFDYSKLVGRIVERYGTRGRFAEALGLTKQALSLKLKNFTQFSQKQIVRSAELLGLTGEDISEYFFRVKG